MNTKKSFAYALSPIPALYHRRAALGLVAVFSFFAVVGPTPAAAAASLSTLPPGECDISTSASATTPCSSLTGYAGVVPGALGILGARTIAGAIAATPIDAFGYCHYVANQSANSLFIPFKTAREWTAFLVPAGGPGATQSEASVEFLCTSADGTAFNEIATPTITGIDSGYGPTTAVGWNLTVAYQYDGACGSANGTASATTPSSDLCHVGAASAVTEVNGIWNWICTGGNGGGTTDTCSAPTNTVTPGSATYATAYCGGSGTFVVPAFNTLTVQVWGAGGGGGGS